MGLTTFFGIIHEFYCTILANFYLYLQYFQQKVFNFGKISRFQKDLSVKTKETKFMNNKKNKIKSAFVSYHSNYQTPYVPRFHYFPHVYTRLK